MSEQAARVDQPASDLPAWLMSPVTLDLERLAHEFPRQARPVGAA